MRDYSASAIRRCLNEILAHFAVYRTYARVGSTSRSDKDYLGEATERAESTCLLGDRWLVPILGEWLSGKDRSRPVSIGTPESRVGAFSAPQCAAVREGRRRYSLLSLRKAYLAQRCRF
jgi:maltooligosyltrehalose synthase